MTPCNRTLWYEQYTRGLSTPQYGVRSPNTFTSADRELIALYASAPNHVFGQMLGLPGSYVLVPYVPLYPLR